MTLHNDFSGRTVLITGASSGIGKHLTLAFARRGARVVAAARRSEIIADYARDAEGDIIPLALDLTAIDSFPGAFDVAEKAVGPIEIVVNNAGVALETPIGVSDPANFDLMFGTNVRGTYFLTLEAIRRMVARNIAGRVIVIASVAGLRPIPALSAYGMSKAALVHMTRSFAREFGRKGIAVNAICPGYVETEINRDFFASEAGMKAIETLPRQRLAHVSDLEEPVMMLASGQGVSAVNGAVITVDDGYSVQ